MSDAHQNPSPSTAPAAEVKSTSAANPASGDKPPSLGDKLRVWPQYALPQHALSRLVLALTRIEMPGLRNAIIKSFMRRFEVDMEEAAEPDPLKYESFNAFFTRSLRDGARPIEWDGDGLCCPADGAVSQLGRTDNGTLLQAKGKTYTVAELLGANAATAETFAHGSFITVYLAPTNYHRVHMPATGTLRSLRHIPGRLFSVNTRTASVVPRLFVRNERTVSIFDTAQGAMAIVMVGAFFVGGIEHVWSGVVTPVSARKREPDATDARGKQITLKAGEEMGRFNMGSTVIVLHESEDVQFDPRLAPGTLVRMGEKIA